MTLQSSFLVHDHPLWVSDPYYNDADYKTFTVHDPFDQRVIATLKLQNPEEIDGVIQKSHQAFKAWKDVTPFERSRLLMQWYHMIMDYQDELAFLLSTEQGKPLLEAKAEIKANADYLVWFSGEARRLSGDVLPAVYPHQQGFVLKKPVGVVASITPWNFPVGMILRKAAPALAAGCSIVVKPALETPLCALALQTLAIKAGLPHDVFQVILAPSPDVGEQLTSHPLISKISFTGSTKVGKWLAEKSASTLKRLSLELGGNAPFIVFEDADLDKAIEGGFQSKFRNSGQTCICVNRFLIHRSVVKPFIAGLKQKMESLVFGRGTDPDVNSCVLIHSKAVQRLQKDVDDAVQAGAILHTGGRISEKNEGYFLPTLLENIPLTSPLYKEEIFGSVACVNVFDTEEEAINLANDSPYGLAGYAYTQDYKRLFRLASQLENGIVGLNTVTPSHVSSPFGGIKESGLGREGSIYGLDDYLEKCAVWVGDL